MSKILMPSQKKFYNLGDGWTMKETLDGVRGLYHVSAIHPMSGEEKALLRRAKNAVRGGATVYSDAFTIVRAGRKVAPNIFGGSLRTLFWNFASLPAGNVADVLVCGKLYKGDRVLGGNECHGALTSGGSTATGSYGTYAVLADGISLGAVVTAAKFLAASSMEAAGNNALAPTIALGFGYEATDDLFLVAVNSVEAFATAGQVTGHLLITRT
jgi:hypothetical protein